MTLHVIAPFHVEPSAAYSHDAFASLVRLFGSMMGQSVLEYSNGSSESGATQIPMLTSAELAALCPHDGVSEHRHQANLDSAAFRVFDARLTARLDSGIQSGDILLHGFGRSSSHLLGRYPQARHVEPWVGYDEAPWGANRVYPSQAFQHHTIGKYGLVPNDFDTVIPHPIDGYAWPEVVRPEGYLLYFGRVLPGKGLNVLRGIADMGKRPILVVGQGADGDRAAFAHPRLIFLPPVTGDARAELLGNARALLAPTRYVEPFGMVSCEAQACGTPVLCSPYGGWVETVEHGSTGYHCHTLGDWLEAIERAPDLSRRWIASRARQRFDFNAIRPRYARYFAMVEALPEPGWYTRKGEL